MPKNDWNEYKQLFLAELIESKEFRTEVRAMVQRVDNAMGNINTEIGKLKVKAAIAGGIAGLVGTGIVTAVITAFK